MRQVRWLALALAVSSAASCALNPPERTASLTDTDAAITATVQDETGSITGIKILSPVPDWAFSPDLRDLGMRNDAPNVVWLTWTSGTCPTEVRIQATTTGQGTRLAFDPGKRCQSDVGKARVLAIAFKDPTDASSIDAALIPDPTSS